MVDISIGDIVVTESGLDGVLLSRGCFLDGGEFKDVFSIEAKSISTSLLNEIYSVTGRIYLKKDVDYIKSFKHMIGVECFIGGFYHYVGDGSISLLTVKNHLEYMLFYDDDSNELTYKEYMMLYYPEYEFVWKEQLDEN